MLRVMRQTMRLSMPEDCSIFVEMTGLDTLEETRAFAKTMEGLRAHGYRFVLSITAGSQLTRLVSMLPVDLVKVQPALVADAPGNRFTLELLTNLIRALHGIGIGSMADHVNSKALFDVLREAGIDYVTGSQAGRIKLASTLLRQLHAPPKAA
jgi:EAL domain-containing protein (putative c-di-GMP-specific phosphodiesterase class I)